MTICRQQVFCMLLTDLLQVDFADLLFTRLLQVATFVTSLQMTSCIKPDFERLVATWLNHKGE